MASAKLAHYDRYTEYLMAIHYRYEVLELSVALSTLCSKANAFGEFRLTN